MKDNPDKPERSENEALMKAFTDQFTPALKYCRTERHNGRKIHDGWMCGYCDPTQAIGLTVISYDQKLHAFLELHIDGQQAAALGGSIFADAIRRIGAEPNG